MARHKKKGVWRMSAFVTGKYRNIFAEIGKSEEEIQKKIQDAVKVFFYCSEEERIYHPVGHDDVRPA